jgi:hypothetical protein
LIELEKLKAEVFRLLREDEEFRYAVAGLIGLGEIIKRLEAHDEKFIEILKRLDRHDEKFIEILKRLDSHDKKFIEMLKRLDAHDAKFVEIFKRLEAHDEKFAEIFKRLDTHDEKFVEILKRLEVHDEKFIEILKRLDRHECEIAELRKDMDRGFELMYRHISALGARWGMMAEDAFREGLRGLLEKEFGLKVERWSGYDEDGLVFGYPSNVEVDVAVKDEKIILIEVSSHIRASDVFQFKRKAELYQRKTGRKPDRLLIVTPYADEKALEASKMLGIEVYTNI